MSTFVNLTEIIPFTAPDGARVQQIAGRSEGMTSHSLAVISHPPGTESTDHHHTVADEVYLVWSGRGRVRVDGETWHIGPGRRRGDDPPRGRATSCGATAPRTSFWW